MTCKLFTLVSRVSLGLMMTAPLVVGCGSDGGGGATPDAEPATGTCHYYVHTSLNVPEMAAEKAELAQDIDRDGTNDNHLADLMALVVSFNATFQDDVTASVDDGSLLLLHRVHADSLTDDPSVLWQVYEADDIVPPALPDFGGSGIFTIAASSPQDAIMRGAITGGTFDGGPGTVSLALPLTDPPVALDLVGVRINASVDANGVMTGKMGGALTEAALDSDILPGVALSLTATCIADCADAICTAFDADSDCTISVPEIKDNALLSAVLAPDLDLFDAAGNFNPNDDGVLDSLSIGLGFTAVSAAEYVTCPASE